MKTISAKDLRDHLDEIVERVRRGETIRVTYRSKPAFRLEPDTPQNNAVEPGSPAAMKQAIHMLQIVNQVPRASTLDPHKPVKQLHHELLDADQKYQAHHD